MLSPRGECECSWCVVDAAKHQSPGVSSLSSHLRGLQTQIPNFNLSLPLLPPTHISFSRHSLPRPHGLIPNASPHGPAHSPPHLPTLLSHPISPLPLPSSHLSGVSSPSFFPIRHSRCSFPSTLIICHSGLFQPGLARFRCSPTPLPGGLPTLGPASPFHSS